VAGFVQARFSATRELTTQCRTKTMMPSKDMLLNLLVVTLRGAPIAAVRDLPIDSVSSDALGTFELKTDR
jgi:hypothetical protein